MQTWKSQATHLILPSSCLRYSNYPYRACSVTQTYIMAAVEVLTCPQARPIPLSPMPCGHDKFNSRASAPEAFKMWKENQSKGKALFVYWQVSPLITQHRSHLPNFNYSAFCTTATLWGIFWLSQMRVCMAAIIITTANIYWVLIRWHSLHYVSYICYLWLS